MPALTERFASRLRYLPEMNGARDPNWYREEAKSLRQKAQTVSPTDEGLRKAYLALAGEYERLADILEERKSGPTSRSARRDERY